MTSVLRTDAPVHFSDRREAGRQLAARLLHFAEIEPVVVGVAPDGMPIAAEIAHALGAPLDAVAVEPLALSSGGMDRFGTAAEGGIAFFDPERREQVELRAEDVDAALVETERALERRSGTWHRGPRRLSLHHRSVLLVTDALADEQAAAAAACAVRDRGADRVIFVAPRVRLSAAMAVVDWAEEIVCMESVEHPIAAGEGFDDNTEVSDDEVRLLLLDNRREFHEAHSRRPRP